MSVPVYHHDWNWPFYNPAFSAVVGFGTSAWLPVDIGAPNLYPTALPLLFVEAVLLRIFTPALALSLLLVGLYVSAAVGVYVTCRRLQYAAAAGLGAAAAYVLAPTLFSQLIAGHLGDIVMYAALPWLFVSLIDSRRSNAAVARSALFAAIVAVQVQGVVLAVVAALLVAAVLPSKRRWLAVACVVAGIALANLNTLVGLLGPQRAQTAYIGQEHAVLSWVNVHSSAWADAAAGRGYFTQYDRPVYGLGRVPWLLGLPMAGVIALIISSGVRRTRKPLALGAIFLLGASLCTGLKGPFGPELSWAFVHYDATSLFRELEHAAVFVALPLAIGCAAALDGFMRLQNRALRITGVGIVLLIAFGIWGDPAIAGTTRWLPRAHQSLDDDLIVGRMTAAPGAERFAIFPGRQPYSKRGSIGVDPMTYYRIADHVPIFAYFPQGPIAYAADHWFYGDTPAATAMFARMGVKYAFNRISPSPAPLSQIPPDDFSGAKPLGRASRATPDRIEIAGAKNISVAGAPTVAGGDFRDLQRFPLDHVVAFLRQHPAFLSDTQLYRSERAGNIDLMIGAGCLTAVHPQASYEFSDPRKAWVSGARFGPVMPVLDDALDGSVVTIGERAAPSGMERAEWTLASDGEHPYFWQRGVHTTTKTLSIALGAFGAADHCTIPRGTAPVEQPPQLLDSNRDGLTGWSGKFRSFGGSGTIYLSDAFDAGWILHVDGSPIPERQHFRGNGFANAWVFELRPGVHAFELSYAPQERYRLLLAVQTLVWASLVISSFVIRNVSFG